jgi:chromosome segregation ATPase
MFPNNPAILEEELKRYTILLSIRMKRMKSVEEDYAMAETHLGQLVGEKAKLQGEIEHLNNHIRFLEEQSNGSIPRPNTP